MNSKKIGLGLGIITLITIILFTIINIVSCEVKNIQFSNELKERNMSYAQRYVTTVPDAYVLQNGAFEIYNGNREIYRPYSDVNEDWLQNALNIYNNSNINNNTLTSSDTSYINVSPRTGDIVTLQDVKDYLSSEYNDDGTPKTYLNGVPQNLKDFFNWESSSNDIPAMDYDLNQIIKNNVTINPTYNGKTYYELTDAQKAAVNYKLSNPDYNLDLDNPTINRPRDPIYEATPYSSTVN